MRHPEPLSVWDRAQGRLFQEWMDDAPDTYETTPLQSVSQRIRSHPLYAALIGLLKDSPFSTHKIKPFIQKYQINMDEFEPRKYTSYDDFFIRKFRPGVRFFPEASAEMGAFAEARYFAWETFTADQTFPVKGHALNAAQLFASSDLAQPFLGGPLILARLSPVDYHHVHYPDAGHTLDHKKLGYRLWTVNWKALQNKDDIYIENERDIQILETEHFGHIALVEVGALTVGRVVQSHPLERPFQRGDYKSHFRFGGSAVVLFGEPGAWSPSKDLIEHTHQGIETLVRLGEPIARAEEKEI